MKKDYMLSSNIFYDYRYAAIYIMVWFRSTQHTFDLIVIISKALFLNLQSTNELHLATPELCRWNRYEFVDTIFCNKMICLDGLTRIDVDCKGRRGK